MSLTKKDLQGWLSKTLKSARVDERFYPGSETFARLELWLKCHHYDGKSILEGGGENGVSYFRKGSHEMFIRGSERAIQSPCFYICYANSTRKDSFFSISLKATAVRSKNIEDFRTAIAHQIEDFKAAQGISKTTTHFMSDYSNARTPIAELNVDHYGETFRDLLDSFCGREGFELGKRRLNRTCDKELYERWVTFHSEHARLRLVSSHENNSVIVKEYNLAKKRKLET